MENHIRITLGQLNPTVGDLAGNAQKAWSAWEEGRAAGSALVALPEMFLAGYNPQDLAMRPAFLRDVADHLSRLAARCSDGPALAIGAPWLEKQRVFNAYFILSGGSISTCLFKHHLPNEAVFDEMRVFEPGQISGPYVVEGLRIGSPICEDAWHPDVSETLAETGAEVLLVPNGSPYHRGKLAERQNHMVARVVETGLPLIYLNMVGGQDDQVFDGASFALNPGGALALQLPHFEECVAHVTLRNKETGWEIDPAPSLSPVPCTLETDYRAMVESLRDYMSKTGFRSVVLGLSGGVDSALVATIAADALGAENVRCVMLPSEYTSEHSLEDARALASALKAPYQTIPITAAREAVTLTLAPVFEGLEAGLTEENIQSRLRGVLLMALSNKFGDMLLTTGNKSEVAVGYATIYGDMAGGYNPLKDLYKTRVFKICRWRNENHRPWMLAPKGAVIPERIITKPPSAELREDQKDSDSLPDYPVLDAILELLIDKQASLAQCVAAGFEEAVVTKVQKLVYISEYKRFQSAPGPRLSEGAFWLDRRYPIVNRWRDKMPVPPERP